MWCEGCWVMLVYLGGLVLVRCSACGAVTRCAERATLSMMGEGSLVKSVWGGDYVMLMSDNLVVVENLLMVSESGKIVSNIVVGVRLGSDGGESRRGE